MIPHKTRLCNLNPGVIFTSMRGVRMSTFDQRNQKVKYQFNANGNINFGAIQSSIAIPVELEKLLDELNKAVVAGAIEEEKAIDVESRIKKAVAQSRKPNPDKKSVLENLQEAKGLLETFATATGLVTGIAQAVEMVRKIL
jgi:hypothetical protein